MSMSTVFEGLSQLDVIKKAADALFTFGFPEERFVGDWCMQKAEKQTMAELLNVVFRIRKPEYRWHTMLRRGNLLETLDYLLGLNPGFCHNMIKFYQKWIKKYNGILVYSYGARIQGAEPYPADFEVNQTNQWLAVVDKLKRNPTSRQGTMIIRRPIDVLRSDTPCTVCYHFQIQWNKLYMTTFMRSCDILYGLPFDLFSQSMFFEQMSLALDVLMAVQTLFVANFHAYENQWKRALKVVNAAEDFYEERQSTYIIGEKNGEIFQQLSEVKDWPKNRYLLLSELEQFLESKNDYWLDYLKLIGLNKNE